MTVAELRKKGYKVRVLHLRRWVNTWTEAYARDVDGVIARPRWKMAATGGQTLINILAPDGLVLNGIANCSNLDAYNKKRGVQIALGRALKQMNGHAQA